VLDSLHHGGAYPVLARSSASPRACRQRFANSRLGTPSSFWMTSGGPCAIMRPALSTVMVSAKIAIGALRFCHTRSLNADHCGTETGPPLLALRSFRG
jgi:hypothetical protein